MTQTATLTQKGQITLPKKFRDKIGVKPYKKVVLELKDGYIKVSPTEDILDLAGSYKTDVKESVLAAREKMESDYKRI